MNRRPTAQPLLADGQADVRPADDSRMRIRPIESGDKPLIAGAFAALSEESRYRRFFTPLRELEPTARPPHQVDHHDHEALMIEVARQRERDD